MAVSDKYLDHGTGSTLEAIRLQDQSAPESWLDWGEFPKSERPAIADDALFRASRNEPNGRGGYVSGEDYVREAFERCRAEWLRQNPSAPTDGPLVVDYEGVFYRLGWATFQITGVD